MSFRRTKGWIVTKQEKMASIKKQMVMKEECKHGTNPPKGCIAFTEWAEKKSRTHYQIKCPNCGLYKIWKRKKPGTRIMEVSI